jgi:cation diffusion facilitator CzcD-associated flavoprotein CzcO
MQKCDVLVVGAGPYGLAATTHLRAIKGLNVRVFGQPMSFWGENMPAGMFLRSGWSATTIADPGKKLTLEDFKAATGKDFYRPVPIDCFVDYGRWYQCKGVPDLDQRKVTKVERAKAGFKVTLEDDEPVQADRVVVACGIGSFAHRPAEFQQLPSSLVTHASEHSDLSRFEGKRVVVIGGGQSALESAALLHETGADVEVVARRHHITWLQGVASTALHYRMGKFTARLLYAPTDVGPAGLSQLMARPDLVRKLPRRVQNKLWKRAIRPAGARWLVKRLEDVPITLSRTVVSAVQAGDQVKIKLDDGSERVADHIILGTGYKVNIAKYPFLAPELVQSIESVNGYPILRQGLETSVKGLYILGAPGAWSFGPLMQFVSGTHYASRVLVRSVEASAA